MATQHDLLVLFDLDGTLLRVGDPVHHAAFEHATRVVFGHDLDIRTLDLAGAVDRRLFDQVAAQLGVATPEADRRFAEFAAVAGRFYGLRVADGDRAEWVLPGALDVLRKLRATGIAIAIATGSLRAVAEVKLASAGLAGHFEAGAFGDDAPDRAALVRRAIDDANDRYRRRFLAANAVVVGDTPADIGAARDNGSRVVAVATGRFDVGELDAHGPDAVFADLSNADAVIRAIRNQTEGGLQR